MEYQACEGYITMVLSPSFVCVCMQSHVYTCHVGSASMNVGVHVHTYMMYHTCMYVRV